MAKVLVAFFSASGVTKKLSENLAGAIGADLFEIIPEQIYTEADLNWQDQNSRSSVEMKDRSSRPAIASKVDDMSQYDVVFVGFPVWASNFTPPIRTFIVENKDGLKGKKFAAFACQSGSGAEKALAKLAKAVGIEDFDQKAVFIDPKAKKSEDMDAKIRAFCKELDS